MPLIDRLFEFFFKYPVSTFAAGGFRFLPSWPFWVGLGLLLTVGAVALAGYWRQGSAPQPLLVSLRVGVLLVVIFCLARPSLVLSIVVPQESFVVSWPSAEGGALPLEGGVAVAFRRDIAAAADPDARRRELEAAFAAGRSPFARAEAFGVHDLIDPRRTRPVLCDWIDWIQPRLREHVGVGRHTVRP